MVTVICWWLLLPDVREVPQVLPPLFSRQGVARAAGLAQGAVLACLARKGMTADEVRRVLGDYSFLAGNAGFTLTTYDRYGVQVFWSHPRRLRWFRPRPMAVAEVRYVWACWLAWGD